jgi:nicotinate-nucleotide adenylyltransferase
VAELRDAPAGRVLSLEITQLDISSTAIRSLIAQGRSVRFLTPDRVIDYIRSRDLYASA